MEYAGEGFNEEDDTQALYGYHYDTRPYTGVSL